MESVQEGAQPGPARSGPTVLCLTPLPRERVEQAASLRLTDGGEVTGARPPPCPRSGLCHPVSAGGRVLQLPLVRAEDAGRYSCKASNEVGEDWLHYELAVLSEWLAWVRGWGGGRSQVCRPHESPPEGGPGGERVWSRCPRRLMT